MSTTIELITRAREYRQQRKKAGGIVLLFDGQVYGWKNELRNPEHERPGAIAIDEADNQWEARGGNEQAGADRWDRTAI